MTYHNAIKFIQSAPSHCEEEKPHERIRALMSELGDPQRKLRYVRLAGSNGKTLCGGMVTAVLRETALRTGLLAMPVRDDVRKNILIDGTPLSMEDIVRYTEHISAAILRVRAKRASEAAEAEEPTAPAPFVPTSSEILLAVALLAFADQGCALCFIESDHESSDPSRFLPAPLAAVVCGTIPHGDRAAISRIRSYITRGVQEIVCAPQSPEAHRILSDTCAAVNCRLTLPKSSSIHVERLSLRRTEFIYRDIRYTVNLCGRFQVINAVIALETLHMLVRHGYPISEEAIARGLSSLSIHGKFELLSAMPCIIVDSTHTPEAIETVCDAMTEFRSATGNTVRLCLPNGALPRHYLTALASRGYTVEQMVLLGDSPDESDALPCPVTTCKTVKATAKAALADLSPNGFLLVSGTHGFAEQIRYEMLQILGF